MNPPPLLTTPPSLKTAPRLGIGLLAATLFTIGCAHSQGAEAGAGSAAAVVSDATAQATQGGKLYGQACASCHGDSGQGIKGGAPPVVGKDALPLDPPAIAKVRTTQFHTAGDVFAFVKENMPAKSPGTMTQDEYLAILAFDLQANGVDLAGKPALTPDALGAIVLHP